MLMFTILSMSSSGLRGSGIETFIYSFQPVIIYTYLDIIPEMYR